MDEQPQDEQLDEVEAHLRERSTKDEDDGPTRGDPAQMPGDAAQTPPAAARRRRRNEDLLF